MLGWDWGGGLFQCNFSHLHAHTLESDEAGEWLATSSFFDSHTHSLDCLAAEVEGGIKWGWD